MLARLGNRLSVLTVNARPTTQLCVSPQRQFQCLGKSNCRSGKDKFRKWVDNIFWLA